MDHLVGLLRGAAVDRVCQIEERAICVLDRDNAGTLNSLPFGEIVESQARAAAVDVDRGGESLEERRLVVRATVEDTRFDSVQTFGNVGQIGDEAVVTIGHFLHLLEPADNHVFSFKIGSRGVEVAALAPLEDDIVHQLAALRRLTVVDIDRGRVAGEARDGAGFGGSIASARNNPRHGRNA